MRLTVRITPRGGRDAIDGWVEDADGERILRVRVAAPASEGRANEALVRLLAKAAGVPVSAVRIISGLHSRQKLVEIDGATEVVLHDGT